MPCVAIVLGDVAERAAGPRWRVENADPDYAYLLNSVNIAEGRTTGHIHHPGTFVHALGAGFLMARHALTAPGVPLHRSVLRDPEDALDDLSVALRVVHAAALLALGVAGARLTGSIGCAVVAQGATLLSLSAITHLYRVEPEPLMLSLSLLLSASALMCLSRPRPVRMRFGVISGVLVGAGVASKVTFAPTALAAWGVLIGPRPRDRRLALAHVAALALALLILLVPIWSQLGELIRWLKSLAVHDGYHGTSTGHAVVNIEKYPGQLRALISAEPVAAGVSLGAALLVGLLFIPRLARRLDDPGRRASALLAAVAAAMVLQFLLVAKHMAPRYAISAVGLSGLAVCLGFVLTRAVLLRPWVRRTVVAAAVAGLACGGIAVFRSTTRTLNRMRAFSAEQVALAREADRLASKPGQPGSGGVLIWAYWSSSPAYALIFGGHWSRFRLAGDIDRMFPDRVHCLHCSPHRQPTFMDGFAKVVPPERLQAWAAEGRLYFHMPPENLPQGFRYEPVVPSGGLYRAVLPEGQPAPRH